jgi:hypothetical protein
MLAASSVCLLSHCGGGSDTTPEEGDASGEADAGADSSRDSTVGPGEDATGDVASRSDGADEADAIDATVDASTSDAADGGADAPSSIQQDGANDAQQDAAIDAPSDVQQDAALDAPFDAQQDGASDAASDAAPDAAPPISCDAQTPCADSGTLTCCSGFCVDTSKDPTNCGQCGNACSLTQFCNGTGCDDAILANVCDNPLGTIVLDPYPVDDEAGIAMGTALTSYCLSPPTLVQRNQTAGGVVDPVTGRPITGVGNTFIAGGGSFGQNGIAYIELSAPISPVYLHTDGTTAHITVRATGMDVVDTLNANLTAQHDFFYVQLAIEPQSGTLCFSAVGIEAPGTQAAGYYVSAVIGPALSTYTKTWYVYEWTDTNGDSIADNGDTFAMVASGP